MALKHSEHQKPATTIPGPEKLIPLLKLPKMVWKGWIRTKDFVLTILGHKAVKRNLLSIVRTE